MPRPMQRSRPANRRGQARGGRRGQLEAFERRAEAANATAARAAEAGPIELPAVVSVADLAGILGVPVPQVIKTLFTNGTVATINQALDYDTAAVVATDLGFEVREQSIAPSAAAPSAAVVAAPAADGVAEAAAPSAPAAEQEDPKLLQPRPPVVTIMGHVDHGKTSLLDIIRNTRVAAGEAGGITQHIGAYQVEVNGSLITFLDTPGHEAFTAMRARGAQVTDIAVIDAKMDKSRGAVATLLVQRGTLHVGDLVVAGGVEGRVKALFDDRGRRVKDASPSFPVEVLGLTGVPAAGDRFKTVADERTAR